MQSKKTLIIFYSLSGDTRYIAELIADRTGGELLEIKAETPYKSLYLGGGERVKQERREGIHPPILPIHMDFSPYDTVFIGTPNWGNGIAHPLMTFLSQYPLAGKQLFPFCTHGGGGLAHVAKDIETYCPDAAVGQSFEIYGDGGIEANRRVEQWLKRIGLCSEVSGKGRIRR